MYGKLSRTLIILILSLLPGLIYANTILQQGVGDFSGHYDNGTFLGQYPAMKFTLTSSVNFSVGSLAVGGDQTLCGVPVIRDPANHLADGVNAITFDAGSYDSGSDVTYYGVTGGSQTTLTAGTWVIFFGCNGLGASTNGVFRGSATDVGGTPAGHVQLANNSFHANTSAPFQWFFSLCNTPLCAIVPGGTNTRFVALYPQGNVGTSTPVDVGANIYVNSGDFNSTYFLRVKWAKASNAQAAIADPDSGFTTVDISIPSGGNMNLSTSTLFTFKGNYILREEIRQSSLLGSVINFFGLGSIYDPGLIAATSSTFAVIAPTSFENFSSGVSDIIAAYLASSTISLDACSSWVKFSIGDCLNLMLVPSSQGIANALGLWRQGFLTFFPIGYFTRFVSIVTNNATTSTSTLPTWTAPIYTGPGATTTLTYNMQDMLDGGSALLSSITDFNGHTLRDIIEPFIRLFVAISVLFIIVKDLTMGHHSGGRPARNEV